MKTYKMPVIIDITQDDIDCIVDSAINWCYYWCDNLQIVKEPTEDLPVGAALAMSEFITRGGSLAFHIDEPFEDGGKKRFVLTEKKMLKGLIAYAKKYNQYDFDDYDGPLSDAALQMALFGEVVYG